MKLNCAEKYIFDWMRYERKSLLENYCILACPAITAWRINSCSFCPVNKQAYLSTVDLTLSSHKNWDWHVVNVAFNWKVRHFPWFGIYGTGSAEGVQIIVSQFQSN